MYKNLFLISIGVILGIFIGSTSVFFAVKNQIGDKYEIVKPKIRGDNNAMDIDQENLKKIVDKKLKLKKNGRKIRRNSKNWIPTGGSEQE